MARARTTVVWSGLDEYQKELRRLPMACHAEAAKIVQAEVNAAYVQIAAVYQAHRVTGTLRRMLTISPLKVQKQLTTGLVLRSGSPLAWLFDHGSQARHYYHRMTGTDWKTRSKGTKHLTGRMPARPTFNRIVGQQKRRIGRQLRDMLRRRGATALRDVA